MKRPNLSVALLLACLFAALAVPAAAGSSATVVRFAGHGAARLTVGASNMVYVNLKGLSDGAWAEALYRGSCMRLGQRIVALPTLRVSQGIVRRTDRVSAAQAAAARTGVIRVARGRWVLCASFAAPPVPPPTPTPVLNLSGTWSVASGSWAGYRVSVSTLLGTQEKTGRTTSVSGWAAVADDGAHRSITSSQFTADLRQLRSGDAQTDAQVADALDTSRCPTGIVVQAAAVALASDAALATGLTVWMPARVTLHCVTHDETVSARVGRTSGPFRVSGSLTFRLADYGIGRTVAGGLGTLAETGTFEFTLLLDR